MIENIYWSAKPFYILAKFLGLFPLSLTQNKFEFKWHGKISTVFMITFLIFLIFVNLVLKDGPTTSSQLLKQIWEVQAIIGLSLILLQFLHQFRKRYFIADFLLAIENIDKKVKKIPLKLLGTAFLQQKIFPRVSFLSNDDFLIMFDFLKIGYAKNL